MADTKLKTVSPIIAMEQQASKFAASATLATEGFTIPNNTGDIWCYPSAACHWRPNGTVTTTTHHAVAASEPFLILNSKIATAEIIGDGGAITLTVAYMRGARKLSHAVVRPY